jgi:hypothetical protein
MTRRGGNGWRDGQDPIQRWLRVLATLVTLGTAVFMVVQGRTRGLDNLAALALVLGVALVLLGYESVVRLPVLGRRDDEGRRDDD